MSGFQSTGVVAGQHAALESSTQGIGMITAKTRLRISKHLPVQLFPACDIVTGKPDHSKCGQHPAKIPAEMRMSLKTTSEYASHCMSMHAVNALNSA
jgi:hypothetical protein